MLHKIYINVVVFFLSSFELGLKSGRKSFEASGISDNLIPGRVMRNRSCTKMHSVQVNALTQVTQFRKRGLNVNFFFLNCF